MTAPIPLRRPPRAGRFDLPRLHDEARALAARLRPRLARPRSRLADLPRRARALADAARGYLENRRRAREGREDLVPLYFIWTTHRSCNFRCDYCDDHRGHRYPDLPREGALDTAGGERLLEIMRTRASSVYFAGGEPTLRKDLPGLTRRARDLAYYPIIVNTNGSLLHRLLEQPAWSHWLADTDVVVVSVDSLDPALLSRLWGTDHPEDVLRNLLLVRELAAEQRVKLMINTVIQPGLVDHARDVLELAGELGVWFAPVPMNVGPRIAPGLLDDPAYRALAAEIVGRRRAGRLITGSARLNERLLSAATLECRNTLKPHVDHDGRLFWPCKGSVAVEPARVQVLDFAHVDDLWAHASRLVEPTGFQKRCGAACNWAQNYTTDAYAHGLRHPLSLLREVGGLIGRA
jgi:MoaA/NifB/PqqE/SkfB family radical SAM enzyme